MKTTLRLKAYAPDASVLGALPFPTEWSYGFPFCDVSSMLLNYRRNDPNWDLLNTPCEVAVESSVDGENWTEPPDARYLRIARSLALVGPDKVSQFTLPGYGWLLNKMRQMKTTGLNADGKRMFNSANAGMIMKTLIDEAHTRGVCPGLTYDFTSSLDSNGAAWNKVLTIGYEPGLDLYTILNNLSLQGICDWSFQGRTLRIYNADTVLATTRDIVLRAGRDIKALPVTATLENLVHTVLVVGDSGKKLSLSNGTTPLYWGKWEEFVSQGGVSDDGTLTLFGNAALDGGAREQVQYTTELNPDTTIYEPYIDYRSGNYVKILGEDGTEQSFRVRGINFARDGQGKRRLDLVINDRFVEASIRLARKTNGITGGSSLGGSGTLPTKDPGVRKPAIPTGLVVGSTVLTNPSSGEPYAIASMNVAAVTTDVDGVALEIDRYDYRGLLSGTTAWTDWGSNTNLVHSFRPLVPASNWDVQVRAVSASGTPGAWSASVNATMESDLTPPPAPSAPLLSTRLGTITIQWDGRDSANLPMPKDFRRVDVFLLGDAVTPIAVLTASRAITVVTDVNIGDTYEYYFRAVDGTGNVSPDSLHSSIAVASIMDDPAAALDINSNIDVPGSDASKNTYSSSAASGSGTNIGDRWFQLTANVVVGQWHWDGSAWIADTIGNAVVANIDAAKITTGTLLAARIATGAITADKIAAGSIDGTKITATAIDGKTINGVTITAGTLATGTRTSTVAGQGLYVSSSGQMSIRSATDSLVVMEPSNGTILIGVSGAQRAHFDTTGRFRIFLTDNSLFLDINPAAASQNMLINGAVRMEALNLANTSGTIKGILVPSGNDLSVQTTTSGGHIYLEAAGTGLLRSVTAYTSGLGGTPAQACINSSGTIGVFSSSPKTKINVENHEFSGDFLSLQPISYNHLPSVERYSEALDAEDPDAVKDNADALERAVGLSAEDVAGLGLEEFVVRDKDGEIVTLAYDRLWLPLIPMVRDLRERIVALEEK